MILKLYFLFLILILINSKCWSQSQDNIIYPKSNLEVREEIGKEYVKYEIKVRNLQDSIITFLDTLNINNLRHSQIFNRKDVRTYITFLIEAQLAWVNYTESMCRIDEYASRDGAQGGISFFYLCKTDYAKKRLEELRRIFFNLQVEFY